MRKENGEFAPKLALPLPGSRAGLEENTRGRRRIRKAVRHQYCADRSLTTADIIAPGLGTCQEGPTWFFFTSVTALPSTHCISPCLLRQYSQLYPKEQDPVMTETDLPGTGSRLLSGLLPRQKVEDSNLFTRSSSSGAWGEGR